ncbi:ATP-binding protein, partial [Planctomycetota bacterium]
TTRREQTAALLQISDTGCGIPADRLGRIFEPYYSGRPKGTGLGLATALKLVQAFEGQISVDSEPGKGTSFTIRLPLCTDP